MEKNQWWVDYVSNNSHKYAGYPCQFLNSKVLNSFHFDVMKVNKVKFFGKSRLTLFIGLN
jgi:hypothetical protein